MWIETVSEPAVRTVHDGVRGVFDDVLIPSQTAFHSSVLDVRK